MSSKHKSVEWNIKTPSGDETSDKNNQNENNTEPTQDQTSVEPNTNPTGSTQQNQLQFHESVYSETSTEKP